MILDPVEGLVAILNEGRATGTNKYGLLLAILDLLPEVSPQTNELSLDRIARQSLSLHWFHTIPFDKRVLRQLTSPNKENTTVLQAVETLKASLGDSERNRGFDFLQEHFDPATLRKVLQGVSNDLWRSPIKLLQILNRVPCIFLYERQGTRGNRCIRFKPGVVNKLAMYAPVLRSLIEFRFANMVAISNPDLFGAKAEHSLASFLFDPVRQMPHADLQRELWKMQGKKCLYTGQPIPAPRSGTRKTALDHVHPWSRTRLSLGENFTVTLSSTNSQKSASLLSTRLLEQWANHVMENREDLENVCEEMGWLSNCSRTARIATSLYLNSPPGAPTWDGPDRPLVLMGEAERTQACQHIAKLEKE